MFDALTYSSGYGLVVVAGVVVLLLGVALCTEPLVEPELLLWSAHF